MNIAEVVASGCPCAVCKRLRSMDSALAEMETVFAVCSGRCSRIGKGSKAGSYYGRAYTSKKFARGPRCENCNSPMVVR